MFSEVDAILESWSEKNSIPLTKLYQDYEARSFSFDISDDLRPQIWIEGEGTMYVIKGSINHSVHNKNKSITFNSAVNDLEETLDNAYKYIKQIVSEIEK